MQGPGNAMSATLPQEISTSVFPSHNPLYSRSPEPQHPPRATSPSPSSDPAALLTTLLNAAPVDLCRISEEMRAHPDLQALLVKLACYLSFSPDSSGTSIEEAVVVVGTDRLRVLVYLWSLLRQRRGATETTNSRRVSIASKSQPAAARKASSSTRAALQDEIAYLADFLDSLSVDLPAPPHRPARLSPPATHEPEFFELTGMLVRDIISFIPLIEPAFRKQPHTAVAAAPGAAAKKDSE
jgi:hypothetical protein